MWHEGGIMGMNKTLEKRVLDLEKKVEALMQDGQRTSTSPVNLDAVSLRIQEMIQKQISQAPHS